MSGSGNLTLSGDNSALTGKIQVQSGTLTAASTDALGSANLDLAGGTTLVGSGGSETVAGTLTLTGNTTVTSQGAGNVLTFAGAVNVSAGILTTSGAGDVSVTGTISGSGFGLGTVLGQVPTGSTMLEGYEAGSTSSTWYGDNTPTIHAPATWQGVTAVNAELNQVWTSPSAPWKANQYDIYDYVFQVYSPDGYLALGVDQGHANIIIDPGTPYAYNDYAGFEETAGYGGHVAQTYFGMGPNGDGWHNVEVRFTGGAGVEGDQATGQQGLPGWGANHDTGNFLSIGFAIGYDQVVNVLENDYPAGQEGNQGYWGYNGDDYMAVTDPALMTTGPDGGPAIRVPQDMSWVPGLGTAIIAAGTGNLTLGGDNSGLTGQIQVQSGTLTAASSDAPGSGNLILAAGTTLAGSGSSETISGAVTLTGNVTIVSPASDTLTFSGPIDLGNNTLTISGLGSVVVTGAISGDGNLIKIGSGTLTLSGGNTYAGGTTLAGGTLDFAVGTLPFSTTTPDITFAGGTLQWAAGNTEDVRPASRRWLPVRRSASTPTATTSPWAAFFPDPAG